MLIILAYFPSGGYVDDIPNNRTNHQFISVIVVHLAQENVVLSE